MCGAWQWCKTGLQHREGGALTVEGEAKARVHASGVNPSFGNGGEDTAQVGVRLRRGGSCDIEARHGC